MTNIETKEFEKSVENGEFITSPNSDSMKNIFNVIQKKYKTPRLHRTTINLYSKDMEKAEKLAKQLGISKQVFLRDFIHEGLKVI